MDDPSETKIAPPLPAVDLQVSNVIPDRVRPKERELSSKTAPFPLVLVIDSNLVVWKLGLLLSNNNDCAVSNVVKLVFVHVNVPKLIRNGLLLLNA